MNQFRPAQVIKYYVLIALLGAAGGGLVAQVIRFPHVRPSAGSAVAITLILIVMWLACRHIARSFKRAAVSFAALIVLWCAFGFIAQPDAVAASSLQTGLLDPIPLMHRSVNLVVLTAFGGLGTAHRIYGAAGSIGIVFLAAVLLNLWIPRFYCRFICPLGALFGALVRWTPWRIAKRQGECNECELCENTCEGACDPFGKIRVSECLLCMNCLRACRQAQMTYGPERSAAGEVTTAGVTRRGSISIERSASCASIAVSNWFASSRLFSRKRSSRRCCGVSGRAGNWL